MNSVPFGGCTAIRSRFGPKASLDNLLLHMQQKVVQRLPRCRSAVRWIAVIAMAWDRRYTRLHNNEPVDNVSFLFVRASAGDARPIRPRFARSRGRTAALGQYHSSSAGAPLPRSAFAK